MTDENKVPNSCEDQGKVDFKVVKKIFPRCNNKNVLEFVLERDSQACLQKNKLSLHFVLEIDEAYVPDNGWASKLFSMLQIQIDSQIITSNKTR